MGALRRPLGEGRRQGPHRASSRSAASSSTPSTYRHDVPVLLARRQRPAHPARAPGLVHPHDRGTRTRRSRTTARSAGCPSTSRTAASATSSPTTSTGRSRASATGARRSTSGSTTKTGEHEHAPASVAEIRAQNPQRVRRTSTRRRSRTRRLNEHLIVHKPWIDEVTFPCPALRRRRCAACPRSSTAGSTRAACPSRSGASRTRRARRSSFDEAFPADFISEAIDQTRGWFYSLLMISHARLRRGDAEALGLAARAQLPAPVQDAASCSATSATGRARRSRKSKGNYTPPEVILERVRMEFAVARRRGRRRRRRREAGVALIAREDYEGLDLAARARRCVLYRARSRRSSARRSTLTAAQEAAAPRRRCSRRSDRERARRRARRRRARTSSPSTCRGCPQRSASCIEDPAHAGARAPTRSAGSSTRRARRGSNTRHSLVERARAAEGVPGQAAQRLLVLHHLREHRRLRSERSPAVATRSRALRARPLDPLASSHLARRTGVTTRPRRLRRLRRRRSELVDLRRRALELVRAPPPRPLLGAAEDGEPDADKRDAYYTLYECLVDARAGSMAPFTPFLAEEMYQNLVARAVAGTDAPRACTSRRSRSRTRRSIDEALSREIRAVRELVSLGLQVRTRRQAQGAPAALGREGDPRGRRSSPTASRPTST